MEEQPLGGGNSSVVVRAGDTVRRPAGEWTASVARFMNTLVDAGLEEVPAHLGIDAQDREIVRFIAGEAGRYPLADWPVPSRGLGLVRPDTHRCGAIDATDA